MRQISSSNSWGKFFWRRPLLSSQSRVSSSVVTSGAQAAPRLWRRIAVTNPA